MSHGPEHACFHVLGDVTIVYNPSVGIYLAPSNNLYSIHCTCSEMRRCVLRVFAACPGSSRTTASAHLTAAHKLHSMHDQHAASELQLRTSSRVHSKPCRPFRLYRRPKTARCIELINLCLSDPVHHQLPTIHHHKLCTLPPSPQPLNTNTLIALISDSKRSRTPSSHPAIQHNTSTGEFPDSPWLKEPHPSIPP